MPIYTIETDKGTFDIDANREPTPEEARAAIAQQQSPAVAGTISAPESAAGALPALDETMQRVLARTSQAGQFPESKEAGAALTTVLQQLVPAPLQGISRPLVSRIGAPLRDPIEAFSQGVASTLTAGLSDAIAKRAGVDLQGAGEPRMRAPFAFTAGETAGALVPTVPVVGPAKTLGGIIGRSGLTGGIFGFGGGIAEEIKQEEDPTVRGALIRGAATAAYTAPIAAALPGVPIAATKVAGVVGKGAGLVLKNLKNLVVPSANNLLKQAVRFPVATGAPKRVDDILKRSTQAILKYDLPVEDQQSYLSAIQSAKKSEYGQFKEVLGEAADQGLTVDATDDLEKAVQKIIKENPALRREKGGEKFIEEIESLRDAYSGPIPLDDAENAVQIFNARLESTMRERNIQPTSLKAFPELQAQDEVRKILRNRLVETLNKFKGEDLQGLRNNYGALSELEEAVVKRMIIDGRQLPINLTQGMALFQGFGSGLAQAAEGRPIAALGTMVGQPIVAGMARKFQEPDELIKRAFTKIRQSKEGNAFTKALQKFRGGSGGTAPPAAGGSVPPVIPTSPVDEAIQRSLEVSGLPPATP